jgi:small-conductance mechanosensitive channel
VLLALVLVVTLLSRSALAAVLADEVDRSTPRRAMSALVVALQAKDYKNAAAFLDLTSLPAATRLERGPLLAEQLARVLEMSVWIELEQLSDDAEGNRADGANTERVGTATAGGVEVPITMARLPDGRWAVSASTVARIPILYEAKAPGLIETRVPAALKVQVWGLALWQWVGLVVALALAFVAGRLLTFLATRLSGRLASKTDVSWDDELIAALRRPSRFLFGVLAFDRLRALLALSAAASHVFSRLLGIVTIGAVAWAMIGIVSVISSVLERQATAAAEGAPDAGLRARGLKTKVRVLRRVVNVAIAIVAVALMLTQFEIMRSIGMSLLASAGVAGVVLGFAAQRTIGSLIAGIQLSFTQPIRIGDVVIVEKEWGTIEEVTLTFVVVRIWDERRLIVPMSRFLEQPFENWTKVSPQLHGTVFFHADFSLRIDAVRGELDRILTSHPLWDGRTKTVAVTNTTERTIEVRILVSAANAGDLFSLRADIREKILSWLQQCDDGRRLPRLRVEPDRLEGAA